MARNLDDRISINLIFVPVKIYKCIQKCLYSRSKLYKRLLDKHILFYKTRDLFEFTGNDSYVDKIQYKSKMYKRVHTWNHSLVVLTQYKL